MTSVVTMGGSAWTIPGSTVAFQAGLGHGLFSVWAVALMLLGKETEAARDLKRGMELKPEAKADIERRVEIAKRLVREGAAVAKQ